MWSWDVECDTCAICRVQVRIRHCLNFLSLFLDEVNIHFTSENTCTLKHTWKYMYLICRWWMHVCAVRVSQKLTPKVAARTASSSGENVTTHSITAACHYGLNRCDHYRKKYPYNGIVKAIMVFAKPYLINGKIAILSTPFALEQPMSPLLARMDSSKTGEIGPCLKN